MKSSVVRESTPLGNQRIKVHHSESSASNSRSRHHNRCGYVSRAEVLTGSRLTQPESKSGGSRENISRTPFSIREFIDA